MITIRLSWFLIAVLAVGPFSLSLRADDLLNELSAVQLAQFKKGEQVLITEKIEGLPWPRVKIYRMVQATPEEVTAVFVDYSNAKTFVPNLLKSDIAQKVSPLVTDVDYALDVPILPDEYYSVRNTLAATPSDGFKVKWKLLRAVQTKDTVGSMCAEPYNGMTAICYQNLVTPGSGMAGLLRGKAIDQMQETVKALVVRIESQKKSNPDGLAAEVKELRDLVSSQ